MLNRPNLFAGLFYAFLGLSAFITADTLPGLTAALVGLAGIMLTTAGVLTVGLWMSHTAIQAYTAVMQARARTERVLLIEQLRQMEEWQAEYLRNGLVAAVGLPGSEGPLYSMDLNGKFVPQQFIREFFAASSEEYLDPINRYSEGKNYDDEKGGGKERDHASALTNWLVLMKFAAPANSSHSAAWLDKDAAARWLGV